MIKIAHLMEDFGMGGVTRALTLFDDPLMQKRAQSRVISLNLDAKVAPKVDADMIVDHAALSWTRLAFLASLRARNPKARLVHVEHTYTRAFEAGEVPSKRRFRALLRMAARLFDDIVCVSQAQRQWLCGDVGVAPEKLRVIYPWTDREELFSLAPAQPQTDMPIKLLAYGRYASVKNFAELIKAMRWFNPDEAQLTLFGNGPDRAALEALAAELPNVDVHGPCSDPVRYLAACDAVILPSRYEAFGLVATEARMAGRGVIVAKVDGLPEQAELGGHAAALGSAQDIAKAIRWAMSADLERMGAAARRGVKSQAHQILRGWAMLIEDVEAARSNLAMAPASANSDTSVA